MQSTLNRFDSPTARALNSTGFGRWNRLFMCLLGLLVVASHPVQLSSQEPLIDREAKIKAAYLYQFIRYVQWPEKTFENRESPIVIGVVGNDPVNPYLRVIAKHRSAGNRKLVYQPVTKMSEAKRCQIIFFSDSSEEESLKAILTYLRHEPILTVGESENFLDLGGVLTFVAVNNNIRLKLSTKAAASSQLKISSQLAKLAQIVN